MSPPHLVKALNDALDKLHLGEVVSASKTRLSGEAIPKMSRLDRWYASFSEAERALVEPEIWLPPHSHEPGLRRGSPSDHFPVLLQFSGCKSSSGLSRIPLWVVRDPKFATEVERRWDRGKSYDSPCRKLRALDKLITAVAKEMMKDATTQTTRRVDAMALALKVMNDLRAGTVQLDEAVERCSGNPYLDDLLEQDDVDSLFAALEGFFTKGSIEQNDLGSYTKVKSTFSSNVNSYVPPTTNRQGANASIRAAVNSARPRARFLVSDSGDRICDGEGMAELLRDTWEPIWAKRLFDETYVTDYLGSYTKRLKRGVADVVLDDVMAEIAHPRASCPGPDGIPFAAYAVICELVAPIFFEVISFLVSGGKPLDDFNDVVLFFIPKDDTHRPACHRPIAASNSSNRIIANVVRRKLEPAILEMLEGNQTGFVRGRSIEEHIRFFNEKFYGALYTRFPPTYPGPDLVYKYVVKGKVVEWDSEANPSRPDDSEAEHYRIFFLDFAKAYDNVSRRYLFRLLELIGVPRGYINILWALYHNVKAIPAVGAKTRVRIPMLDGLKQGCPLSCLLFILSIDVLLMQVNLVPSVDPRCFADDLAVGFTEWKQLAAVLCLVDEWSLAAGPVPNVAKTKFITTESGLGNYADSLPHAWREVKVVDSYVYLGVLIGASVDVTMVYDAALAKLQSRVANFMRLQSVFSLAERVRIANTYFIPVLSYLHRFYIMTAFVRDQVEATLQSWLIKGTETNVPRLCAPKHAGGLHSPLRNPCHVNVASVLRGARAEQEGARRETGSFTMLMSDQVLIAAEKYESLVGTRYPDCATQAALFLALQHADPAPVAKLGETLLGRVKRHPDLGPPGCLLGTYLGNCLGLPSSINESLRNQAFNLIHSLLFVGDRFKGDEQRDKSCVFCGDPLETVRHVFCDCPVTQRGLANLLKSGEPRTRRLAEVIAAATVGEILFRAPLESKKAVVLLTFTRAVWRARWTATGGSFSMRYLAELISTNFISFYRHRFGWTVRDRDLERRVFLSLLASLPASCYAVYTDGSSLGNPGLAGSGFAVYDDGRLVAERSYHLGLADNNYAELHAVLKATDYLLKVEGAKPIFLFVDNRHAIRLATGVSSSKWGVEETEAIRANLELLATSRRVALYWVPGHAGVEGNERADRLAKQGARRPTSPAIFPNTPDPAMSVPPAPEVASVEPRFICPGPRDRSEDKAPEVFLNGNELRGRGEAESPWPAPTADSAGNVGEAVPVSLSPPLANLPAGSLLLTPPLPPERGGGMAGPARASGLFSPSSLRSAPRGRGERDLRSPQVGFPAVSGDCVPLLPPSPPLRNQGCVSALDPATCRPPPPPRLTAMRGRGEADFPRPTPTAASASPMDDISLLSLPPLPRCEGAVPTDAPVANPSAGALSLTAPPPWGTGGVRLLLLVLLVVSLPLPAALREAGGGPTLPGCRQSGPPPPLKM